MAISAEFGVRLYLFASPWPVDSESIFPGPLYQFISRAIKDSKSYIEMIRLTEAAKYLEPDPSTLWLAVKWLEE